MSKWRSAAPDRERGSIAVEFGMIAPFLVMMVLGVVQGGLLLNQHQGLHAAAREGARLAALPDTTDTEIHDRVDLALDGVALTASHSVTISPNVSQPCNGRTGETVTVTVDSTTSLDIPFLTGRTVNLVGAGTYRCE